MKAFRGNKRLLLVQIIIICIVSGCAKNNKIDNFQEVTSFISDFNYCLSDKKASYQEIIDSSKINWALSSQLKKNVSDSLLVTDSKYLSIRKNFSLTTSANNKVLLLKMSSRTSFVAYLNGREIMSYDMNLIRANNPAFTKEAGSIAIFNCWAVQNFFIPQGKIDGLLKETNNELLITIMKQKISTVHLDEISLFIGCTDSDKTIFDNKHRYGQDAIFTRTYLPIIFIQTNGQIIPDNPKIRAVMGIVYNKNRKNKVRDSCRYFYGNIGIELRGQTSQSGAKQSYGIKTCDSLWERTDVSLFGMPAEDDWILYGPYFDISLIRDALVYRLSNTIGRYAVRTQYVELVINNDYRGVYVFMERIGPGKKKVDISPVSKNDTIGDKLTGAYIFKIDMGNGEYSWKSAYPLQDSIAKKQYFLMHYPKKINDSQKKYVINTIARFEETLYNRYYSNEIFNLIDDSSFIDYFIINELTRNIDAYRLSTFLYKDCDSIDPRLHMGPVWDYNFSLGLASYLDGYKPEGWVYKYMWEVPFWWKYLLMNEVFKKKLIDRWEELRKNELSSENIIVMIDEEVRKIGNAEKRNFIKWPVIGTNLEPNYNNSLSYKTEITYLKTWINKRLEWIDLNIKKL